MAKQQRFAPDQGVKAWFWLSLIVDGRGRPSLHKSEKFDRGRGRPSLHKSEKFDRGRGRPSLYSRAILERQAGTPVLAMSYGDELRASAPIASAFSTGECSSASF
jgi:hypothetical protein